MKAFFIVIIFGGLACIDIPGIVKNKQWRELTVYSTFLLLGLTVALLHQVFKADFSVVTHWFIRAFSRE